MKTASLKEIKTELYRLHPARIQELCIQMAKFKKENKELLTYLLFGAYDETAYIEEVKSLIDEQFKEIKKGNAYLAKKIHPENSHDSQQTDQVFRIKANRG